MGENKSNITKSVIIIGAGLGGLTAGCYAQMNGYNSQIFEMHDKAGGLCTAWERKGYTIDGVCIGYGAQRQIILIIQLWKNWA